MSFHHSSFLYTPSSPFHTNSSDFNTFLLVSSKSINSHSRLLSYSLAFPFYTYSIPSTLLHTRISLLHSYTLAFPSTLLHTRIPFYTPTHNIHSTLISSLLHSCHPCYTNSIPSTLITSLLHSFYPFYTNSIPSTLITSLLHSFHPFYTYSIPSTLIPSLLH